MRETFLKPDTRCSSCDARIDAASSTYGDHAPKSGDVTVCLYCGHIMAFADDLTIRELTTAEAHEVAGDKRVLAVQRARKAVFDEKEKKH